MKITRQPAKAGFNLIELLMVIAIIALLAATVISSISRHQVAALQTHCTNNLRQLGVALQEFALDHGYYPAEQDPEAPVPDTAGMAQSPQSNLRYWRKALEDEFNMFKDVQHIPSDVWDCPAASRPTSADWAANPSWIYQEYAYNADGFGLWDFTNSLGLAADAMAPGKVRVGQVVAPWQMYALGDGFMGSPSVVKDGGDFFGRGNDSAFNGPAFSGIDLSAAMKRSSARHQGEANVAFCDGHVEPVKLQYLFVETDDDDALAAWNRDHLPHRERLAP